MLDLFISYINFIILSMKYIVKRLLFFPPNPKGYKIIENTDKDHNKTEIYIKNSFYKNYNKLKKIEDLDIEFQKIQDNDNNFIPLFIIRPLLSFQNVCIIYCHGNSCDIGSILSDCFNLAKLTKCIVVSFDYPGYGIYEKVEPNEKNIYQSIQIIYEFVKDILNFDENNIIVYGFSLGTGVAFDLACNKNYNFAGLILQSPFLSIVRTMYNTKKTKYFDLFNNCDKAKLLNVKTLFIHGNRDKIVPYIHGRILSKLIPQEYLYDFKTIDGAGHNNIFSSKYFIILTDVIRNFIEKCCSTIKIKDSTAETKRRNKINYIYNYEMTHNICKSFSKIKKDNNIVNASKHDTKIKERNKKESEKNSFSENNSAFLIRKKQSYLDSLKQQKYGDSNLNKTNSRFLEIDEEKNGLDSTDKFLKEKQSNYNNDKLFDKSGKNNISFNKVKAVNDSESNITQKENF